MTYGHADRAPAEDAVAKALARASGTWGGYQVSGFQAWRRLDAEKRLELIEQALTYPANDLDSFPVAL
jgi:hypothetical protein